MEREIQPDSVDDEHTNRRRKIQTDSIVPSTSELHSEILQYRQKGKYSGLSDDSSPDVSKSKICLSLPKNASSQLDNTNHKNMYNKGNLVTATGNMTIGDQVMNLTQKLSEQKHRKPLKFGLPLLSDSVIARESDVDELFRLITSTNEKRVAITGVSGVGKTTLAIHCACTWSSEKSAEFTKNIAFINSESTETISRSINSLASELDIRIKNRELLEIVREIFNQFTVEGLLIIYDNVDSYHVIKNYLPENMDNIYVLATSQITELKSFFNCYELKTFDLEGTEGLIRNMLSGTQYRHITEADIIDLHNIFDGLALGLILAVSYIKDSVENLDPDNSVKDYIKTYQEYLNQPFPDNFKINYKHTIYIALKINIDKIKQKHTQTILMCMSFMNPMEIEEKIFTCYFENKQVKEAIRVLVKFSIVKKIVTYRELLTVHRLLQEICRSMIENKYEYIILALRLLILSVTTWDHCSFILDYVEKDKIIEITTEAFRQSFSSGTFLEYIKKDLEKIKLDLFTLNTWNAWHFAVYREDIDMVRNFINKGLIYEQQPDSDWNILHAAALRNSEWDIRDIFTYLPNSPGIIDVKIKSGLTSLHISAALDCISNVESLIKCGCDVNIRDNNCNNALHWAVLHNNDRAHIFSKDIIETLINSGVDINLKNNDGLIPLENFQKFTKKIEIINGKPIHTECSSGYVLLTPVSPSGELLEKRLITWEKLLIHKDSEHIIKSKLKDCSWWNDEEESLVNELVITSCNSMFAINILISYMLAENVTIKKVLNILKHCKNHTEMHLFTKCCSDDHYKNIFKIICMVIDKIEKKYPEAFKLLTYIIYASDETILHLCTQIKPENITVYIHLFQRYSLYSEKSYVINELVTYIMNTYLIHRNLAISKIESLMNLILEKENLVLYQCLKFMHIKDIQNFYRKTYKYSGQLELINKEIEGIGTSITPTDDWSALHYACADYREPSLQIIHRLIKLNADTNLSLNDIRPIHLASIRNRNVFVPYWPLSTLLKENVAVNVQTREGLTPLHFAAFTGSYLLVRHLLNRNSSFFNTVDVNMVDNEGNTAAHFAARGGYELILKDLLKYQASMTVKNCRGETPESLYLKYINKQKK